MARRTGAAALLAALLFAACQAPITLPASFVELEDGGEGYRAVTSDDARLWVRELYDPTEGDVEFWVGNLRRDFVDERGYELVDEGEVEDRDGTAGRWLQLRANVAGENVGYLIAVWADGHDVTVVEFAAAHDVFTARLDAVRAALRTVR